MLKSIHLFKNGSGLSRYNYMPRFRLLCQRYYRENFREKLSLCGANPGEACLLSRICCQDVRAPSERSRNDSLGGAGQFRRRLRSATPATLICVSGEIPMAEIKVK